MDCIFTPTATQNNYRSSDLSLVTVATRDPNLKRAHLPTPAFKSLKAQQHEAINQVIIDKRYKTSIAATLRALVNRCDTIGESRVSQAFLASLLFCSVKTIQRHLDKLEEDGVIIRFRNGWKVSNTTVVLAIQHLNIHKEDKMSRYLTSLSFPKKEKKIGREQEKERGGNGMAYAPIPPTEIPFEVKFEPLTSEEIEIGALHLKALKEMLK